MKRKRKSPNAATSLDLDLDPIDLEIEPFDLEIEPFSIEFEPLDLEETFKDFWEMGKQKRKKRK